MALSIPQEAVGSSTARFRVLIAGRRMGKTYLSVRELARFAKEPNRKVMYVAPSYRMAKQIIWKDLKKKLLAINWVKKINESELTILLVNGSEIMLRSADNYDSMRGLGVDFVVFDEFADIPLETWTEVVRPALSDRQGHAMFVGTPKGVGNWAKDLYDKGQMADESDWDSWQFTTLEGGNVTEAEVDAAKQDLDTRTFRQEYMASFETYSDTIYYNFNQTRVEKQTQEITPRDILHIGLDFNVSPMSAVIATWDRKTLQVFDEIIIYGSNTAEIAEEINNRYPNNRKIVYPDASGGARSTNGRSDHLILQQYGFTVKSPRKNPPVRDRINSVNAAFENTKGVSRLSIHETCKHVKECLLKQSYKTDTAIPDKDSGFDHMNDALGYMVFQLMPIKGPEYDATTDTSYYGMI